MVREQSDQNHYAVSSSSTHYEQFTGTLMEPQILYRVIYGTTEPDPWQKKQTIIRPAVLRGFRRQQVRNADYPAIVPVQNPSILVRGAFVSGLTDMEVTRLDHYEGFQYTRQRVKVKILKTTRFEDDVAEENLGTLEGEEVDAETYVWTDSTEELSNQDWNFAHFKKHRMHAWTGESSLTVERVDEGFAAADAAAAAAAAAAARSMPDLTRPAGPAASGTDSTNPTGRSRGEPGRNEQGRGAGGRGDRGSCLRGAIAPATTDRGSDVHGKNARGTFNRGTSGQGTSARDMSSQGMIRRSTGNGGIAYRGPRNAASDELRAALAELKKEVSKSQRRK